MPKFTESYALEIQTLGTLLERLTHQAIRSEQYGFFGDLLGELHEAQRLHESKRLERLKKTSKKPLTAQEAMKEMEGQKLTLVRWKKILQKASQIKLEPSHNADLSLPELMHRCLGAVIKESFYVMVFLFKDQALYRLKHLRSVKKADKEKTKAVILKLVDDLDELAYRHFYITSERRLTAYEFQTCYLDLILKAKPELTQHQSAWEKIDPVLKGFLGVLALVTFLPFLILCTTERGYKNTFFSKPFVNKFTLELLEASAAGEPPPQQKFK